MSGDWLCPYLTIPGREHAAFNGKKPPAGQLARRVEERVEADHHFGRVALSAPRQGEVSYRGAQLVRTGSRSVARHVASKTPRPFVWHPSVNYILPTNAHAT